MIMNPRVTPKTCACGASFIGGPTAKYCPSCRAERTRQRDRERHQRKLAGKIRHLGSIDLCALCGSEYTVNAGPQRHCPECQVAEAKRRSHEKFIRDYNNPEKRIKMLDRSRKWALNNRDRMAEILRQSYDRRINVIKDKRRMKYGYKLRPLGRDEICPKCGSKFIVEERNQKYCADCKK